MRTLVVVNPASARGRTGRRWPGMAAAFDAHLGPFELAMTERAQQASELVRQALRSGVERVIAVGGDGTNHEAVQGFFDPETRAPIQPDAAFAFVSSGTGGDFGRSLKVERDVDRQLQRIAASRAERRIDLIGCEFDLGGRSAWHACLNAAGVGHGGDLVRRAEHWKWLGRGGLPFVCAGIAGAIELEPWDVELRIDDGPWEPRSVRNVAAFNGSYQGGGMCFAPRAALDDGQFQLFAMGPLSPPVSIGVGIASFFMDVSELDGIEVRGCRRVEVRPARAQHPMWIEIDGESPGGAPVVFEIMPAALRLAM